MKSHVSTAGTIGTATAHTPLERALAFMLVVLMVIGSVGAGTPAVAHAGPTGVPPSSGQPLDPVPPEPGIPSGFEEVISIPIGSGSGEAGILSGEEIEPWGPSSFAVDSQGRFWVIDGVNRRVLVADPVSGARSEIEWADPVACPVDIAMVDDRVFLLDLPAQPAAVREIDTDGQVLESWDIPAGYLDHGVTALDVVLDRKGRPEIRLELGGAWQVALTGPGSAAPPRLPVVMEGDVMRMPAAAAPGYAIRQRVTGRALTIDKEWSDSRSAQATAFERGRAVAMLKVDSAHALGAVRSMGSDHNGDTYLWAEDLPGDGARVRAFVKRYSADGRPTAVHAIPVEMFATHPMRPVRITEDGISYLLVPGTGQVSILRARWTADNDTALPAADTTIAAEPGAHLGNGSDRIGPLTSFVTAMRSLIGAQPAIASWTPVNANDRAWTYRNHRWYCTTSNYATRNGSIRPRYITAANRYYNAVPYCWGGFDTIGTYSTAMSAGRSAGDINCTGDKRAGTAGVDCSGFVSRLWGQGTKRSTYTLRNVARTVSKTSMRLGDAYIWPGRHCMFFRYYTSGGAQVFESTKTNSYDRVVTMNRTNTALANYGAWRYNNW